MRVRAILISLLVVPFLAVGAVTARTPQVQRTIYVNAMDQAGIPVTDLKANEVRVLEDNKPREVTSIEKATDPMAIAILVDTSPGIQYFVNELRESLGVFTKKILAGSPESQISIGEFGGVSMTIVNFTSSADEIAAGIPKLLPKPEAPSVLNEALVDTGKALGKQKTPRRLVLIVNSEPAAEGSQVTPKTIADEIRKSGATVWAVSVQKGPELNSARDALLKGLANNTGGFRATLQTPAQLQGLLGSVADHLLATYAVTFQTDSKNAQVTNAQTNRPGVRLSTKLWSSK
jgi:VWFA-related protein